MSTGTFLLTFFVCSAALALWLDARLGSWSPQSIKMVILHGGCSLLAIKIVSLVTVSLVGSSFAQAMLGLFLVLLPGLIYVWLASIWFLKLLRSAMPR